jgi:hypothetical protein
MNSNTKIQSVHVSDITTGEIAYTFDTPVFYSFTGNQTLAYNSTGGYFVWCNDTNIFNITLNTSPNSATVTPVVSDISSYINGVLFDNNITYYFCVTSNTYTIYTLSNGVSSVHRTNTLSLQYDYFHSLMFPYINITYKNGICYLTYEDRSTTVFNKFHIEYFNLSTNSSSQYYEVNLVGDTNNYFQIHPMGLPIDDNGNIYISIFGITTLWVSTNPLCFNEGTKILCLNQQLIDKYNAIELLQIGDFVKTYKHGYRKIHKIIKGSFKNNPKKWNMCMYKIAKTDTNGLIEDLIVTGGHSLLVDAISDEEQKRYDAMGIPSFSKLTIDNKHLLLSCCSDQFTPMQDTNRYNYYHLLLENNDDEEERFGIWANGILTETPNVKTVSK